MTCKDYSADWIAQGDCRNCGHSAQSHFPTGDLNFVRNLLFPYRLKSDRLDLSDLAVVPLSASPWLAEIEEPLQVEAPSNAEPLCCYIQTVIFYEQPYRVIEGNFAEFGRCETRLQSEDVLIEASQLWRIYGGSVAYSWGRWVMVWRLRKYDPN